MCTPKFGVEVEDPIALDASIEIKRHPRGSNGKRAAVRA
jgi:hypothetical protein